MSPRSDEQHGEPLRRRAAELGRATAMLVGGALALLAVEVWLLVNGPATSEREASRPGVLPFHGVGVAAFLAAGALTAATFVALAALQTAAAMRVLSPHRQLPPPLPAPAQRLRRIALAPAALRRLEVEEPPAWPPSAVPSEQERPPAGARLRCHVLIPAHDEEAVIDGTLASLRAQTRPPDDVLVIADNCADHTVEAALAAGVRVVETVGNTEKKAGALNQELARLLPTATPGDVVLVMDADSTIDPEFLEVAMGLLEEDPDLMAVGGLFYGEPGGRLVGQCQRNEYSRYQRLVARRLNRVFVLTGTASVIRTYALDAVARARGPLIPGPPGQVYDTVALTEDNELTLALRSLGARMTSPPQCIVTTEIMPTWRDLWRQRQRWYRGALENIGAYGLTRATLRYWLQQLGLSYGVVALYSFLALFAITMLAADQLMWSPFWVTVGLIFFVERLATVWAAGRRARLLALPVVPELLYSAVLQACYVASLWRILVHARADWNYVPRAAVHAVVPLAVVVPVLLSQGVLLPASILHTTWYHTLSLWVGFNTLVFAALSLVQLLPPLSPAARRSAREARLAARR
ncbi:glycosyltransferase family 2 protein [Cellulomonas massiliensis]|uniref:glycosyltransferase family 2 protein n=1 Tax=Cellulomonas massiliensis TaxID=1465811 RepID=UPI00031F0DD7|nr:glycosyltransferase family 2 protein [Cellulomonas massiliensis]